MRLRDALFAVYACVCLAALTRPGFALVQPWVEGLPLGLPFALLWNIGWVGLTFAVLAVYHRLGRGRDA